jgi:hypothetical protein
MPVVKLTLRAESVGPDWRFLWVYCDGGGDLHVEGQDLGPAVELFCGEDEYEWFETVRASDLPRLVEILGGADGEPIMSVLERYRGSASYDFERRLHASGILVRRHSI